MTGQVVLVIVVVAAAVITAIAISLRLAKASHHPKPADTTPTVAEGVPTNVEPASGGVPDNSPTGSAADQPPASTPTALTEALLAPPEESTSVPQSNGSQATNLADTAAPPARPTAATPALAPNAPPPEAPQVLQPAEIFAKLFDLALGKSRPKSTVTAGHDEVVAATALALQDADTQQRYVPRRPNMLPKILSASSDDNFSHHELAALIARDPSLVGNLLKIANSSYYRVTAEPVESVDRAVVLLGTNGIRSLVTAALMQPIFRVGGADFPRFPEIAWEHTFRSANAAVPYNFLLEKSDPFAAELLSLVLGLAEIVVFRVTLDQYAKIPRLRPDAGVVTSILDANSATVARLIGASWELSEPTLAGLDGQSIANTQYPTALGRSLYFGRVVGALAVLRINHIIDDEVGKASIPVTSMPEVQQERMWTRLTPTPDKR